MSGSCHVGLHQDAAPVMGSKGFMVTPCPPVTAPDLAGCVTLFSAMLFACPLAILARSGSSCADKVPANRVALPALDR
jgi:hypothetical protein